MFQAEPEDNSEVWQSKTDVQVPPNDNIIVTGETIPQRYSDDIYYLTHLLETHDMACQGANG